jgi:hypothetical protein
MTPAARRAAGAVRARRYRARRSAGLKFRGMWVHDRRLTAALRAADRLKSGATEQEIDAALAQVVEDFIGRWIGKK